VAAWELCQQQQQQREAATGQQQQAQAARQHRSRQAPGLVTAGPALLQRYDGGTAPVRAVRSSAHGLGSASQLSPRWPALDGAGLQPPGSCSARQPPLCGRAAPRGTSAAQWGLAGTAVQPDVGGQHPPWGTLSILMAPPTRRLRLPLQQPDLGARQPEQDGSPMLRPHEQPSSTARSSGVRGEPSSAQQGCSLAQLSKPSEAARSLFSNRHMWPEKPEEAHRQGAAMQGGAKACAQDDGPAAEQQPEAAEPPDGAKQQAGAAVGRRRSRLRLPTKRRLEACAEAAEEEEEEGDQEGDGAGAASEGAERPASSARRSPAKAARGWHARRGADSGGGAQKRQPGAAASSRFRGVSRHRCAPGSSFAHLPSVASAACMHTASRTAQ
jgi:hypothetical protein